MRLVGVAFLSTLILTTGIMAAPPATKNTRTYVSHYENVLGTSMELKIKAASEKQAALAEKAALTEIKCLSKILSGYDASSEFSQWMKTI